MARAPTLATDERLRDADRSQATILAAARDELDAALMEGRLTTSSVPAVAPHAVEVAPPESAVTMQTVRNG